MTRGVGGPPRAVEGDQRIVFVLAGTGTRKAANGRVLLGVYSLQVAVARLLLSLLSSTKLRYRFGLDLARWST